MKINGTCIRAMKLLIGFFLSFWLVGSFAAEVELAKIQGDLTGDTAVLRLKTSDKHDVDFFIYELWTATGYLQNRKSFDEAVLTQNGFVALKVSGKDVLTLSSDNFSAQRGGPITIKYASNALTGQYKSIQVELVRNDDKWFIVHDNKPLSGINFTTNKIPLTNKPIGVKDIDFKYR